MIWYLRYWRAKTWGCLLRFLGIMHSEFVTIEEIISKFELDPEGREAMHRSRRRIKGILQKGDHNENVN